MTRNTPSRAGSMPITHPDNWEFKTRRRAHRPHLIRNKKPTLRMQSRFHFLFSTLRRLARRHEATDLDGLEAFGRLLGVEFDGFVFLERLEPIPLDHRVMNENIAIPLFGTDEKAEPFLVVKPLNLPGGHGEPLLSDVCPRGAGRRAYGT